MKTVKRKTGNSNDVHAFGPRNYLDYIEEPLQFLPATVTDVVINSESPAYGDSVSDINSIMVSINVENYSISQATSRKKYVPLLRGMVDVPVKGDPVLVCSFGTANYYLGPLNGTTNFPNFNVDGLNKRTSYLLDNTETADPTQNLKDRYNIPKNFVLSPISRLQKVYKTRLDDPMGKKVGDAGSIAKADTHGDMVFEGRYGNSIRIGSRSSHPLVFIGNGRNAEIPFESFYDNSILGMTTVGSLSHHYGSFQLASDSVQDNVRKVMGTGDGNKFNYNYGMRTDLDNAPTLAGQIYMGSDRIVFNSKKATMTLSALTSIDLGAGTSFTVSTKKDTTIESSNIYLGKEAKENEDQPLVLGAALKEFLDELLDLLMKQNALVNGVPIPLTDSMAVPLLAQIQQMKLKLEQPEFWSDYHYIENNGQKAD